MLHIKAKVWRGIQNSGDGWLNPLQVGHMCVSNLIVYGVLLGVGDVIYISDFVEEYC